MIRRTFLILSAAVALTLLSASTALAQTDSQAFTVKVPSVISVTAPADAILTLNAETDPHSFPPQLWRVKCNAHEGATFRLTTRSAFVNGSFKRDATLLLEKAGGSSSWNVATSTATTNYNGSTEVVSVEASSSKPGAASFNLTVTLVDNSYDDLAAGDYVMTVDGTITAN